MTHDVLTPTEPTTGADVTSDWLRIDDADQQPPFLMSVVSDADLWMYVSSRGGLTCGRSNEDGALFPYETDDKLHEAAAHTGPFTLLRIGRPGEAARLWEPFAPVQDHPQVRRHLSKSTVGNQVQFESHDESLGLVMRYQWSNSAAFGFVRSATLENRSNQPMTIELIDGLRNLMPACVELSLQRGFSCLVNAYTRADVDPQTRLATVALATQIVDKAKPVVTLLATSVWSCGLDDFRVLLCTDQVAAFRRGEPVKDEPRLTGRRAGYFVHSQHALAAGEAATWHIVADVQQTHQQVEALRAMLMDGQPTWPRVEASIREGTQRLTRLVAAADGLQCSADPAMPAHHFANVLFNCMRGGVFLDGYQCPTDDVAAFIRTRNTAVEARHAAGLEALTAKPRVDVQDLLAWADDTADADLRRLAMEYLPLTFSRRHGDPSRPWNRFHIRVRNADGTPAIAYQGNWRDIFQNWEALLISYPQFIESVIAKFVNASTADGFNPYRVTHEGIDWETPDPEDPWANIGYWGDHQIVYLTRLLELSASVHPQRLAGLLSEPIFSYAAVPYRLRPYCDIVKDPRDTIVFDEAAHAATMARAKASGTDAKLLHGADGQVQHVTLAEKLLVPILAKLSSLVPDAGIWMNTQRPEWNDANNALVGNGVSMVTLYQLRRHLALCETLFRTSRVRTVPLSGRVRTWLQAVVRVLREAMPWLEAPKLKPEDARQIMDALGRAYTDYREAVYHEGLGDAAEFELAEAMELFSIALAHIDHAIDANRREDGLYHAYNLLDLSQPGRVAVSHLYEMLEGQVALLSSGKLKADEAIVVLEALYRSAMYRKDQDSFMLYPQRTLPSFLEKNRVDEAKVAASPLLVALLDAGDERLVARDAQGQVRFDSRLCTADDVEALLDRMQAEPTWEKAVRAGRRHALAVYEDVFSLHAFTGRSGAMYGYEGLGCIYWHMVAKLLLAVQECHRRAIEVGEAQALTSQLARYYYRVRAGLGFNKDARTYGAFPADPYSHTPRHAGAQQPGMTGQVKEEILARWGELGVRFDQGAVLFRPTLLRRSEFFDAPRSWRCATRQGWHTLTLPAGSLAFTLGGQPVIYRLTDKGTAMRLPLERFRGDTGAEAIQIDIAAADLLEMSED